MAREEQELIGITVKKEEDFSEWYNQVVQKAELADFSPIKGFMVIRPNGYAIWEEIQAYFNKRIKELGHKNAYFPTLIPENFLRKEQEHVEGFSPEVFWVTHGGDEEFSEKLAMRPTSETIMYDAYSRWVKSWRDLPLLINQWANVFRCETKMTKLFLRTREFLWQEGHTVHATEKEADKEVMNILHIYRDLVQDVLAIPVILGRKTDKERFAGALYTTTLEALMPDGKALQMGTSHNLGQNFSKAFGIEFLDRDGKNQHAWQTSWGVSTRLIGAMIMAHGDDKGLVMPPRVAPVQVVIVPIIFEKSRDHVLKESEKVRKALQEEFRVELDDRDNYSAGWKFNHWELYGVPIRLELGPKDIEKGQVMLVRRDTGEKKSVKNKEVAKEIKNILEDIQTNLFKKAQEYLKKHTHDVKNYNEFKRSKGGFIKAGWCGNRECEDSIQDETTATIRLLPFETKEKNCVFCENPGNEVCFAKSY